LLVIYLDAMDKRSTKKAANRQLSLKLGVVLAASAVLFAGCAANEKSTQEPTAASSEAAGGQNGSVLAGTLSGGGASSQTAAQEAWRAGFQAANGAVTVNYDPTGSGTGRENFTNGGFAFVGTDAAYSVDAIAAGFALCAPSTGIVEIPAYISPIAVGFNLPGIETLNLDASTIAGIFAGKISNWNSPQIAKANPDVTLPATSITPVHRADKSGTTENFTDYLAKTAPAEWKYEVAETWPSELTGEAAEKTQGVRETLSTTEGAIGYLDASQATELGKVAIKVGDAFVSYSPQAAANAAGKSKLQTGRTANDLVVDIDRTLTDATTYPLILISYLVGCEQYQDPATGQLAKAFFEYAISEQGQSQAASNAGSAPITGNADLEPKIAAAVAAIK
jgi:phosphate transport system substrate-binding protein